MEKEDNALQTRISNIGGQAVLEGVMMRGKTSMSLAVRAENGDILLDTVRLKNRASKLTKIPIIRGVINFFLMLVLSVKTLTKSAEAFSSDEGEQLSSTALAVAVFVGLAFSIVLFIILPSVIASAVSSIVGSDNALILSIVEGVVRVIIFIGYLLLTGLLKDIKRTYMYHGAEHKVINCYESGKELNVENVMLASKKHNRCGTTFLFFVIVISIIFFAITNYLTALMGLPSTWWTRVLIRMLFLPLVAGISYELLKGLARLRDNTFSRILRAPGLSLQALTTKEPSEDMVMVALEAFNAVLQLENDQDAPTVSFDKVGLEKTIKELKEILKDRDIEDAEADWILCDVLKIKRSEIQKRLEITRLEYNKIMAYGKKRAESGLPLAYVLGNTEFYGERIIVTGSVLIPRPETELLAEKVIEEIKDQRPKALVLDLCTGSGCIAKAIASNTEARVIASDKSKQALSIAEQNCLGLNIECIESDMLDGIIDRLEKLGEDEKVFDIIVSNPPYIPTEHLKALQLEVKKEPHTALDGGKDGLDFYRRIALDAPRVLKDDGVLFLEIGIDQAEPITKLLENNFTTQTFKDLNQIDRIIVGRRK